VNRGLVVLDLRYLMTMTFATAIAWLNGAPPPGRLSAPVSGIAVLPSGTVSELPQHQGL
jgi:hypothetical protein